MTHTLRSVVCNGVGRCGPQPPTPPTPLGGGGVGLGQPSQVWCGSALYAGHLPLLLAAESRIHRSAQLDRLCHSSILPECFGMGSKEARAMPGSTLSAQHQNRPNRSGEAG